MVLRVGVGEQVVTDTQADEQFQKVVMEAFEQFAWWHAGLVGGDGDWGAVRIGSGDHEHAVSGQTVVAGANVTGQV